MAKIHWTTLDHIAESWAAARGLTLAPGGICPNRLLGKQCPEAALLGRCKTHPLWTEGHASLWMPASYAETREPQPRPEELVYLSQQDSIGYLMSSACSDIVRYCQEHRFRCALRSGRIAYAPETCVMAEFRLDTTPTLRPVEDVPALPSVEERTPVALIRVSRSVT